MKEHGFSWGGFSYHDCRKDEECQSEGAPARLHFGTPLGIVYIATDRDSWTQMWFPLLGYTRWWGPVVFSPRGPLRRLAPRRATWAGLPEAREWDKREKEK